MLPCSFLRRAPRCSLGGIGVRVQQDQQPRGQQQQQRRQVRASVVEYSCTGFPDVFAPSNILSTETREKCVRRLGRTTSLRSPPTLPPDKAPAPSPAGSKAKEAAVLVPLCVVDGEVCLLFTLRSPHMSSHRSQVSFPGGMKDKEDDSFEATALRETEEELGIPRQQVEIWGRCQQIESINRVNAVPVIGHLGNINLNELKFNPKEVGEVFTLSLRHLCDKRNFGYTQFRTGKGYVIPVFLGGKYKVWGLTARVTHIFLSALLPSVYNNKLYYINPLKI